MADERKSLSQLQTALADNSSGAITPQDERNIAFSMKWPQGSIYMTSSAETTISEAGTYVKAAGTTTLSDNTAPYLFDMPAVNRLRYTGATAVHAHIAITVSFTMAGNNKTAGLSVYKNGTTQLAHSIVHRLVSTGADIGSTALHADCAMAQNDYIELWVTNITDATNATVDLMYMFAMGMFV